LTVIATIQVVETMVQLIIIVHIATSQVVESMIQLIMVLIERDIMF
jgi:hypothetical protein